MEKVSGHFLYTRKVLKETFTTQQRQYAFKAFEVLFEKVKPSQILEIGTSFGGTILYIREKLNELNLHNTKIRSYDIVDREWYGRMRSTGIDIRVENIFTYSYNELNSPGDIQDFIQQDGVTVVLCDGGFKKNEFKLLAPFLKKDDIIMAHDYVDTHENFIDNFKGKIWDWREIGLEDIEKVCIDYNLTSYMEDLFSNAVWACRKKV